MDEEKNSFIYKILRFSIVYKTYQFLVIKKNTYQFIYKNIFTTNPNSIVLDCGCGPAQYRKLIECGKYTGIDFNKKHIEAAKHNFPSDTFYEGDLSNFDFQAIGEFTDILLFGILHHLNDKNAKILIEKLINQLQNNGKIVAIDPVYTDDDDIYTSIANFVASKDQGNFVRSEKGYKNLIDSALAKVDSHIYKNLLRIPFYHHVTNIEKV